MYERKRGRDGNTWMEEKGIEKARAWTGEKGIEEARVWMELRKGKKRKR